MERTKYPGMIFTTALTIPPNTFQLHQWCTGKLVRRLEPRLGQAKDNTNGICCFPTKHTG